MCGIVHANCKYLHTLLYFGDKSTKKIGTAQAMPILFYFHCHLEQGREIYEISPCAALSRDDRQIAPPLLFKWQDYHLEEHWSVTHAARSACPGCLYMIDKRLAAKVQQFWEFAA
jgi:hypothetical protein